MNANFTTITDAINWIADMFALDMDGARWIYENTSCPDWDDENFTEYDFLNDPAFEKIPAEFVNA